MVHWAHTSSHCKRHLDLFIRFSGLTVVPYKQTDTDTDTQTTERHAVCSNKPRLYAHCVRCGLKLTTLKQ